MAFVSEPPKTSNLESIPWRSLTVSLAGGLFSCALLWMAVGSHLVFDLAFIICITATLMLSLWARVYDDAALGCLRQKRGYRLEQPEGDSPGDGTRSISLGS